MKGKGGRRVLMLILCSTSGEVDKGGTRGIVEGEGRGRKGERGEEGKGIEVDGVDGV